MDRRFIEYAIRHGRPLKAVLLLDGQIRQKTITVVSFDAENLYYIEGRKKKAFGIALDDVLSVGYARGDSGDTLVNMERELKELELEKEAFCPVEGQKQEE